MIWTYFALGFAIACILSLIIFRVMVRGNLHIDRSDPDDNPYIFLELPSEQALEKRKYIVLEIVRKNYITPQK